MNHIPVLNDVPLALETKGSLFTTAGQGAHRQQLLMGNHLGTDKTP